jgi:uncharacterized membrane protein
MQFAVALPWWGYALVFALALVGAWFTYSRVALQLAPSRRALLTALRALTLLLIVFILLRPVRFVRAEGASDSIVAILVDGSRSMRLADADGTRVDRARAIAQDLQARLGQRFKTELLSFGETLSRTELAQLSADARRSDLSAALTSLADRYRARPLAGVIVLSDGGDTSVEEVTGRHTMAMPVYTIGIGNPAIPRDREVINLTAGEPLLTGSSVDLSVSVTSSGFGTTPIELRLKENGRPLETRRVSPAGDAAPVHELFTVSPPPDRATVYTIEIPVDTSEVVVENNTRSVLVPPQGRRRKVLLIEGAPGFEHTFLKRALARDTALEVDSVVRKGQNDEGRDTFFIQAASSRTAALASGYPRRVADLFQYDAVFFGNIGGDFFSRDQLAMTSDFVARRGGGLLVFGARSFERAGLAGTPLEEALPIDLTDRRASILRTAAGSAPAANTLALTADGVAHPATRVAVTIEESQKRWTQLPPLASVAPAGGPRPGAQILAVTATPGGELRPLIVTQRYGQGRALAFAGEASWRWRMMLPASNNTHELVWRQLARWVASGAADRVEIPTAAAALPGTTENISVLVRGEEFNPVADAVVSLRVTEPGGHERTMAAALTDPSMGRYAAAVRFDQPGVYSVAADVRRGSEKLGPVTRSLLVGGVDLELSQPRLNDSVLRRIAETTGGQYAPASAAQQVPAMVAATDAGKPPSEMRDLWNNGFSLAVIIGLLAAEWIVRRRVGLA